MAAALATTGALIVMGTWAHYMWTIARDSVAGRPVGAVILQISGMVLAVAAVVESYRTGAPLPASTAVNAGTAVALGAFFLWLLSQRKTPIGDLKVEVGDMLLPFRAATSDGAVFSTDELAGKRTLLKFFRGGW